MNVQKLIVFVFVLGCGLSVSFAQDLRIFKTSAAIIVDGEMEAAWENAEIATGFMQFFPTDSVVANAQTTVRVTYDDDYIYVIARMENIAPDRKYVTPSLRRDYRGEANDGFTVVFDTYSDNTNAFVFGVNPYGVQREGLIANGGGSGRSDDFTLDWDNKWISEAKIYEGYWIAEMAIPFKTLRYKDGLDEWKVNFYRLDSEKGERSTWSPIPVNQSIINLSFSKKLIWDKPLEKTGSNIAFIPYTSANYQKNFEAGTPSERQLGFGFDGKVGVGSALNLDLTVNPDFSQVEVDQQVTNLDRFEIFFPERRQFFLENADLFANFGIAGTRPFFSRRIGITQNQSTGQNEENPIYFGARLSGKINNNLRVGLLNLQAGQDQVNNLPATNYTVATLQQKIMARSNIGLIMVNKQAFRDTIGQEFTLSPEKFNRLVGVDLNLISKDNSWITKTFYHHSFDENTTKDSGVFGGFIQRNSYRWLVDVTYQSIGKNYNPEVGFLRRRGLSQATPRIFYNFYPKKGPIQSHGPGVSGEVIGNQQQGLLDWNMAANYRVFFRSTARFSAQFRREFVQLTAPFDPSGTQGIVLETGDEFTNQVLEASYQSDARSKFFFNVIGQAGGFFNGTRAGIEGVFTYRYQPWGFTSLNLAYNVVNLPEPYNSSRLLLIGPRFDFTFSKSLFWTTFVQYNSQISNMNINSRLQWRFKPVSDLFLVYTDNYFASTNDPVDDRFVFYTVGQPKSRAIIFKISYWFTL